MGKAKPLTLEQVADALEQRAKDVHWRVIAASFGVSEHAVRMRADPHYIFKYKQRNAVGQNSRDDDPLYAGKKDPPLLHEDKLLDQLKAGLR